MAENGQWHWQKSGEAWKGVGIYHVTLTVPSREPLLGKLIIPENDPKKARVERTEMGNALVDNLLSLPLIIRRFAFCSFASCPIICMLFCM